MPAAIKPVGHPFSLKQNGIERTSQENALHFDSNRIVYYIIAWLAPPGPPRVEVGAKQEEIMPIYEYHCLECGTVFEKIVPLNSDSISCLKCESPQVEKLFSTFAVSVPESRSDSHKMAPGPCNTCGAAQQGMCQMMD